MQSILLHFQRSAAGIGCYLYLKWERNGIQDFQVRISWGSHFILLKRYCKLTKIK